MKIFKKAACVILTFIFILSIGVPALAEGQEDKGKDILSEILGVEDMGELVRLTKELLGETAGMTDEEVEARIRAISEEQGMTLSDRQVENLRQTLRSLEGLSEEALRDKLESIREKAESLSETATGFAKAIKWVAWAIKTVLSFFKQVFDYIAGLFS